VCHPIKNIVVEDRYGIAILEYSKKCHRIRWSFNTNRQWAISSAAIQELHGGLIDRALWLGCRHTSRVNPYIDRNVGWGKCLLMYPGINLESKAPAALTFIAQVIANAEE